MTRSRVYGSQAGSVERGVPDHRSAPVMAASPSLGKTRGQYRTRLTHVHRRARDRSLTLNLHGVGYYVIGHVHHALHTPLMSVTNAISGIIIVGALLEIGQGNTVVTILSAAAILLVSINIFGGFAVTRRMLSMFSRS